MENKKRPTWVGYYTRKTKTKKEKLDAIARKHRKSSLMEE